MGNDLKYLAKRLDYYANAIEQNSVKLVQDVVKSMAVTLVPDTPILTGRARANWQAEVGAIPTGVLFPEPDKPPTPAAGQVIGINALVTAADQYRGGSFIGIANNVPYIGKLNAGSSAQAPAGFVLKAVIVAIRKINSVKLVP